MTGMRYQPQGLARVDPALGVDFAWLAPTGSLVGPTATPSTSAKKSLTTEGVALSAGYSVVASAAISSLYATTWTEIGVVVLDGTNKVTTLSARDQGQAVVFQPAQPGVDVVMWSVADVNINGTLPTGVVRYVVRRNGSAHTIWLNGKLFGSASAGGTPRSAPITLPAIGAEAGAGSSAGGTPLAASTGVLAVVRTPRALSDAQCLALSGNPWQSFTAPYEDDELFAAVAANTSFAFTPSGGAVFSGSAAPVKSSSRVAVGALTLAGSGQALRGAARAPQGGIALSGASGVLRSIARAAAGGLKFVGAAAISATAQVQARVVTPVGGLLLAGAAAVSRATLRAVSGGLTFSGHALKTAGAAGALLASLLPIFRRRRR